MVLFVIDSINMENIETCCTKINEVAEANWMTAYVSNVGYKEPVIKVCPENRPNTPLLVLRHQAGLYLVSHKNEELTEQYRGRPISLDWVIGFIKANSDKKNKETCGGSNFFKGFSGFVGDEAGDWRDWK